AEDGIRDGHVTGVQTCALPISAAYTSSTFAPSTRTPGMRYASARSAIVLTGNSNSFGVEYANWLLFTTHTTGRFQIAETFRHSRSEERRVGKERRSGWVSGSER